ncbi:hypothetical protein [Salinibacterium sp. ZJ450]|uniref:hypothetical protein n=1 Tax=Salinibacterium sp. ZJ450 TaxID=2708338 RepID=UPI0014218B0E|nr:hypothetical protein [Salinibacterium sp. ZJ450]
MMPIAIASPDTLARLESQLTALRRAIAELDRCMLAHLPGEPATGWRGPARDAYAIVLDRLRRNLIEVRACLVQAQALTAAALAAGEES